MFKDSCPASLPGCGCTESPQFLLPLPLPPTNPGGRGGLDTQPECQFTWEQLLEWELAALQQPAPTLATRAWVLRALWC